MSNFICIAFAISIGYMFSLAGIEYAKDKPKKVRRFLTCSIIIAFSLLTTWTIKINECKIPIEAVEKEWRKYVSYCHDEHISWNELTFPEWLNIEASEY